MLRRVKRWMPYLVIAAGLALILLAYAANFKITEFGSMDETSPDTTTRQTDGSEIFSFAAEDYGVMQKDIETIIPNPSMTISALTKNVMTDCAKIL